MKLKTLKDIQEEFINSYGIESLWWRQEKGKPKGYIFPEELKQEAIKWIKALIKLDTEGELEGIEFKAAHEYYDHAYETDGAIKILKHFFNITEDEI